MAEGILSILLVLVVLAGVMVLAYYTTRLVGRQYAGRSSRLIRVLDRAPLGRDQQLLLVTVAGRAMLIGAAPQGISKLCDIDATDLPPVPDDAPGPAFSQIFSDALHTMRRARGGDEVQSKGPREGK